MKDISRFSPLTETTFYILLALVEPLHGYGIMEKVKNLSSNRIRPGPGTLYGALANLLDSKLIVPAKEGRENSRRKIYRITQAGKELLEYESRRLEENVRISKSVLKKD